MDLKIIPERELTMALRIVLDKFHLTALKEFRYTIFITKCLD